MSAESKEKISERINNEWVAKLKEFAEQTSI